MPNNARRTLIFWDTQGLEDGWAFRTITDAGEESGPIDGAAADCCDALRDGVKPPEGSWDALMAEVGHNGTIQLATDEGSEPVTVR